MAIPRTAVHARTDDEILHPRDILRSIGNWVAGLDRERLIQQAIEWPGSKLMWALKLGRFPKEAQATLRDQNTVAGVLGWLYVLGFVIAVAVS